MLQSKDINVGKLTTFGISAISKKYIEFKDRNDISSLITELKSNNSKLYILGEGSNTIFLNDYDGIVLHVKTKGISIIRESENEVIIKAEAGEIWDDFVQWSIQNNFGGIENLTAIPGTVGACPIQNIGAYGSEVMNVISNVEFLNLEDYQFYNYDNKECNFSYRDSIFKQALKNKVLVLSVTFSLSRTFTLNMEYSDIQNYINNNNLKEINQKTLSEIVRNIRVHKLPDPSTIGNSGSFFKNPIILKDQFVELKSIFPTISSYPISEKLVKIAAGWLIDQCGWKGKINKGCKVHDNQALVLTNYNNASADDLIETYQMIQNDVFTKFGVLIEPEVNLIK